MALKVKEEEYQEVKKKRKRETKKRQITYDTKSVRFLPLNFL